MLIYDNDIIDINDCMRIYAIIITKDGNIYSSDINHQECMLNYKQDFFSERGINILTTIDEEYDFELYEAIKVTNNLFVNNDFYGFDIYESNHMNEMYFVAHYPQNLKMCYEIAKTYADANELELASFTDTKTLGRTFRKVTGIAKTSYPLFVSEKQNRY